MSSRPSMQSMAATSELRMTGITSSMNERFCRHFSLMHKASVLLNIDLSAMGGHVARNDAKASIKLYNEYLKVDENGNRAKLEQARQALLRTPTKIPLFRHFRGRYENVCLSGFNRGYCRCGQPMIDELHQAAKHKRRSSVENRQESSSPSTAKRIKLADDA